MRDPLSRHVLAGAGAVMLLMCGGCASQYHPEYHPVSSYTLSQNVSYPTIYQYGVVSSAPAEPAPTHEVVHEPATKAKRVDASRVLVVESSHLDRPNEVIGVVDVEDPRGTHDSGVALLRERAAEVGADAVVSVEFHQGDGAGHLAHASGLAVRFQRGGAER